MTGTLTIKRITGRDRDLESYLEDLAQLRIKVFRAFPYLYDGSIDYEMSYLETYTSCPESIVVLVMDGEQVVGATTGLPLDAETAEFQKPFIDAGYDASRIFYCAESVLLSEYGEEGSIQSFLRNVRGTLAQLADSTRVPFVVSSAQRITHCDQQTMFRWTASGRDSDTQSILN